MAAVAASLTREQLNYALVEFRGVPVNPSFDVAFLGRLTAEFVPRAGDHADVFVNSYPKAGTTWTQTICFHLAHGGSPPPGRSMYATVPWIDTLASSNAVLRAREGCDYTLDDLAAFPADRPRFFKAHATVSDIPGGGARGGGGARVVYVARNPKDTVVSLWHHARDKPEFALRAGEAVAPDFEQFVRLFLAGQAECGSWFDHNLAWFAASRAEPSRVLFLQYETMFADPTAAVRRIAAFVGLDGDDEALVARTVEGSSMETMRKGAGAINVRAGGSGKWRKMIKPGSELDQLFNETYLQQMEGSGLVFDFGEGVFM